MGAKKRWLLENKLGVVLNMFQVVMGTQVELLISGICIVGINMIYLQLVRLKSAHRRGECSKAASDTPNVAG